MAPETLFAAIDGPCVSWAKEIVVLFVAESDSVEFLLRHLQLQIHLFAHALAGLAIGHKQLYSHPDNEEQRR